MFLFDDHLPPHFHAKYSGNEALIDIENSCVIKGALPSNKLKLVLAWTELHKDELKQNWEKTKNMQLPEKNKPFGLKLGGIFMGVIQVIPMENYKVAVYFADGIIKEYDVAHLVGKGVFKNLENIDFYKNNCTVLNNTLAWTLDGKYDGENCIDIDPYVIYKNGKTIKESSLHIA